VGEGVSSRRSEGPGGRESAGEPIRVVLATRNRNKVEEIVDVFDLPEIVFEGLDAYPEVGEVVEDGDTFEANARKKATEVAAATGRPALADDSGLVVDALGGCPGVHSARYSGPDATSASNREKLLREMAGVPEGSRSARFVCALCLARPSGEVAVVTGSCEGVIIDEERGDQGFGYDPLFVPRGRKRTFAEMSRREKAELSHRGKALRAARERFGEMLRGGTEWSG
jgi:XTP/dITP diphosphohydrolase